MKKIVVVLAGFIVVLMAVLFPAFYQFSAVTKGAPIPAYPASKTALLVIDVQKDMTEKTGKRPLNLAQTDAMIPVINTLLQDAGKKNWLVIYITHEFSKNSIMRLISQDTLLAGKPGADMDPRILVVSQDRFIKHQMDTFSNSAFEGFLKEHAVGQLILTGMAAEACVDRTCQGALNRKYHVTVVRDAIASASDESREKKIRDYEKYGAQITTSQDILTTHR